MLKKKSSVQISIEGYSDKSLVVPTILIKHWKHIAISLLTLIVCFLGVVLYITTQKKAEDISSQYEASLDKEKEKIRVLSISQSESEKDILEAKKSFTKIDSTLDIINSKMRKRGLKTISLPNAGGPVETEEDFELLSDYYEEALKEIDKKLSNIPLGVPHPGKVSSKFGYRANPFTNKGREMHSGIDLKGNTGDPILSTASGTVSYAGYEGQYGNVVKILHANGYETRYAHLSRVKVKKGQKIDAGNTIGLLGSTGRSTGPHLHYEILKNSKKINPEKYFSL